MLIAVCAEYHKQTHYSAFRYIECRYVECRGATERCLTRVDSGLTHKHHTMLKWLARDHYSILLRKFVNYSHKKLVTFGHGQLSMT
jgi:hypothetical protein